MAIYLRAGLIRIKETVGLEYNRPDFPCYKNSAADRSSKLLYKGER
jgi:hypothetical protein